MKNTVIVIAAALFAFAAHAQGNETNMTPANEQAWIDADALGAPHIEKMGDKDKARYIATGKKVSTAMLGALKKTMRDPDSFKAHSAMLTPRAAMCVEFQSKNGFGGMNQGFAVLPYKGTITMNDETAWNGHCAGKVNHGWEMLKVKP